MMMTLWKSNVFRNVEEDEDDDGLRRLSQCVSKNRMSLDMKAYAFERKGQSWYVATDRPSDITVEVGDSSFHLHKLPLVSRSGRMDRLLSESGGILHQSKHPSIKVDDIPGGEEAFELVAKFCYGLPIDLTANNIAVLRCAAEYMDMTEDMEEGNLISKTERFLGLLMLSSWKDSILVLQNCEKLSPWAENLNIVKRCSDSIAWKACADRRGISWSFTATSTSSSTAPKRNWDDNNNNNNSMHQQPAPVPHDWWFEDISVLSINHFVRVISAIEAKGMRPDLLGASIMHYSSKWLPGILNLEQAVAQMGNGDTGSDGFLQLSVTRGKSEEQRLIIESIISIIPPHKDVVSTVFLLRLLRMANMFHVTPALVTELEKRVGMKLEEATLSDLLIPCYSSSETLYDVDLVRRILEHFLIQEQSNEPFYYFNGNETKGGYNEEGLPRMHAATSNAKNVVAKLVDSYLAEVARDSNLSLTKFQALAEALPDYARTCDDGLYRAIDTYLKTHPELTENERKRVCRIMDSQKLSLDACMHAAQNERLPVRTVLRVLFSEQLKIRSMLTNCCTATKDHLYDQQQSSRKSDSERESYLQPAAQGGSTFQDGWSLAKKDIKTIKGDMKKMKLQFIELQQDYANLQGEFEKLSQQKSTSTWNSGWKKLGHLTNTTSLFQRKPKMNTNTRGNNDLGSTANSPHQRKSRRWRNSIS